MGLTYIGYLTLGMVAIVAVVLALRSNIRAPNNGKEAGAKKFRSSDKRNSTKANPYRATAIVSGENNCQAAKAIGEKRFLVADRDIPRLPLTNCDVANCTCTYSHYEDRRNEDGERRGPMGLHSELHQYFGQMERRVKRGRRELDWA
jgi:hypothetical protein